MLRARILALFSSFASIHRACGFYSVPHVSVYPSAKFNRYGKRHVLHQKSGAV